MARLVLVDAEALEKAQQELWQMCADDDFLARLTPVVPELPKGCLIESEGPDCIVVKWTDGQSYQVSTQGIATCEYDEYNIPLDCAAWLLARFQALQGGA